MNGILANVQAERKRQVKKWGQQDHHPSWWLTILAEEFGEAAKAIIEGDFLQCHEELVQVSAVAASAAESIERNNWGGEVGLASLQQEVKELAQCRKALEWYADRDNYRDGRPGATDAAKLPTGAVTPMGSVWRTDRGDRARAALEATIAERGDGDEG